jgi:hypothetical protein
MGIRTRIANLIDPTHKNSTGILTGREFLRNGGGRPMVQDWSHLIMNEDDKYTGLMYAAIEKRANLVTRLADENLRTKATKAAMEAAKQKNEVVEHPYLPIIDSSEGFSDYEFWHNIAVYLDLRGVFYLGVIRTVTPNRIGDVMEFELLNPYKVERVTRQVEGKVEVGGYREWQGAYFRDWPVQQIIEMRKLNPFKPGEPYSMSDAAKDSQFTLKQAGDYTRHALSSNASAPGIYSTDVQLTDELFDLFVSRIKQNGKGEPIIANGAGAVTWDATQIELNKAALDKVVQVFTEPLLAVSATSKTSLGIEQSGVTRDTSKVMSDQLTTDAGMPLLRFIIEALNQDYKRYYPVNYKQSEFKLFIDSPLGKDRDAEAKDVEIRSSSLDLYQALLDRGYEKEVAARYAAGEISLEELGEPKNPPAPSPTPPVTPPPADTKPTNDLPAHIHNDATDEQRAVTAQESSLHNSVEQVEEQVALAVIAKVAKNAYDEASDVISNKDKEEQRRELFNALLVFFSLVVPLQAKSVMQSRMKQYGKAGTFTTDAAVRKDLRATVKQTMVAEGDVSRIASAVSKKYPDVTAEELKAAVREAAKGGKSDSEIAQALRAKYKDADYEELLKGVRQSALKGAEHDQLVKAIRQEYAHISQTRAKVIARTETNRAFTMSQYHADRQFLDQNGWTGQAYKKWVTRSSNPCPFCQAKAAEPAVPFDTPFADIGDVVTANVTLEDGTISVRKLPITYETVDAGSLHVNCVLPGTRVRATDATAVIRANYSGDVFEITTEHGRRLTVTPNHIMLTSRGWVAAKFLLKTDRILSYGGRDEVKVGDVDPDDQNRPSTIEEVFTAAREASRVTARSMPVAPEDLKGDGAVSQGNVDVVTADSLLGDELGSSIPQTFENPGLEMRGSGTSQLIVESDLRSVLLGLTLASDGVLSSSRALRALLGGELSHAEYASFATSTTYNARLQQAAFNDTSIHQKLDGELLLSLAREISLDHISNIKRFSYSGHVYDISTTNTSYITNGLITSNCSCGYELEIR